MEEPAAAGITGAAVGDVGEPDGFFWSSSEDSKDVWPPCLKGSPSDNLLEVALPLQIKLKERLFRVSRKGNSFIIDRSNLIVSASVGNLNRLCREYETSLAHLYLPRKVFRTFDLKADGIELFRKFVTKLERIKGNSFPYSINFTEYYITY